MIESRWEALGMASLPSGTGGGSAGAAGGVLGGSGGDPAISTGVASPSAFELPPVQLQVPFSVGTLQSYPLVPPASFHGGTGGLVAMQGGAAPSGTFLALPLVQQHQQQQQQPGIITGAAAQLPHFPLPLPSAGGSAAAALGALPLDWPLMGDAGTAGATIPDTKPPTMHPMQLPAGTCATLPLAGMFVQPVIAQQQQQLLLQQQAAQSAPQMMSNTDAGGSTEGTQACGGEGGGRWAGCGPALGRSGGRSRSRSGTAGLEGEESAAAESRLKPAPSSSRRAPVSEHRKSRFRGVQWDRSGHKWRARIHTDKTRHIGYFEKEEAAGQAWDLAALKYFGACADIISKLNFPASLDLFNQQQQQQQQHAAAAAAAAAAEAAAEPGEPEPQYRGVAKLEGRYRATVTQKRVQYLVGMFDTAEEAARAYDRESLRLNGRGAITNFPLSDYVVEGQLVSSPEPRHPSSSEAPNAQPAGATRALWQRAGSAGPGSTTASGGAAGSVLHTPAGMAGMGEGTNKRRRIGEESASAPSLLLPPAVPLHVLQQQQQQQQRQQPAGPAATAGASTASAGELDPLRQQRQQQAQPGSGQACGGPAPGAPAPAPAAAAAPQLFHSSPEQGTAGSHLGECTGFAGVRRLAGTKRYHTCISVDLGEFESAQEAARAYDRAQLLAGGLQAPTHHPLSEAFPFAAAACTQGWFSSNQHRPLKQQEAEQPAGSAYRGVLSRGGAWLAMLDIGGSPYELGPFSSALDAARAYDRYSILLTGIKAQTNFPPWEYFISEAECLALLSAVRQVQAQAKVARAASETPEGGKAPSAPPRPEQGQAMQQSATLLLPTPQQQPLALPQQQQQQQHLPLQPPPVPPPPQQQQQRQQLAELLAQSAAVHAVATPVQGAAQAQPPAPHTAQVQAQQQQLPPPPPPQQHGAGAMPEQQHAQQMAQMQAQAQAQAQAQQLASQPAPAQPVHGPQGPQQAQLPQQVQQQFLLHLDLPSQPPDKFVPNPLDPATGVGQQHPYPLHAHHPQAHQFMQAPTAAAVGTGALPRSASLSSQPAQLGGQQAITAGRQGLAGAGLLLGAAAGGAEVRPWSATNLPPGSRITLGGVDSLTATLPRSK